MDAGEAGNPWIDEEVYLGASRIPVFLNFTELQVCLFALNVDNPDVLTMVTCSREMVTIRP